MRARELAAGASSSRLDDVERSTTKGANIASYTTYGSLLLMERVSGYRTCQLVDRRRYAP